MQTKDTYTISSALFLRLLGAIYLMAFLSLGVQITGLVGERGILPFGEYLEAVRALLGPKSLRVVPTLFWLGAGDLALEGLCWTGAAFSVFLLLGWWPVPVLVVLWVLYLSVFTAGRVFLGFQWDILLLETGFLAIFLAPFTRRLRIPTAEPPRVVRGLYRWLLFRLVFMAGAVKLLSGDRAWRNLTALNFHYETQPIPSLASWYVHGLPEWFQRMSVAGVFFFELVLPFFIFAPRTWRRWGCAGLALFQLLILLTGNYGFFNWLAILLCLLLLDDTFWSFWPWAAGPPPPTQAFGVGRPSAARTSAGRALGVAAPYGRYGGLSWPSVMVVPVAVLLFWLSTVHMMGRFGLPLPEPELLKGVRKWFAPFHLTSPYGLFAVMTTRRPEIVVEGSVDGKNWLPYEFKFKPGDLDRPPPNVAPHMPRLDWQMWFAALGSSRQHPWFTGFLTRLLEGSPEVLRLLAHNPFPDGPPRYVRALSYDYHFTTAAERQESGAWWKRKPLGLYRAPVELSSSALLSK